MNSMSHHYRDQVLSMLDLRAEQNKPIAFWWRDDDATRPTPALERLIGLSETHGLPLALAVIPKQASGALVDRIRQAPTLTVLQHGFAHKNHSDRTKGHGASEFGEERSLEDSLRDLKKGRSRMHGLFAERAIPVFVPPWNRMGGDFTQSLSEVGFKGYSAFGQLSGDDEAHRGHLDVHWDPITWKGGARFCGTEKAWKKLAEELERRTDRDNAPLGLVTHHLAHDEDVWSYLNELLRTLAGHPGAVFPPIRQLFGLRSI
ncbi:MAG: polysaccharide deacetylase family protein [Stappiaceae bacterium]